VVDGICVLVATPLYVHPLTDTVNAPVLVSKDVHTTTHIITDVLCSSNDRPWAASPTKSQLP
jgi:hypothetical protein